MFRSFSIYTFSNLLSTGIPFLILPYLTYYLTPEDYGVISIFQVLCGFLFPFVGINSQSSVSLQFVKKDKGGYKRYLGNSMILTVMSFTVVCAIAILFGEQMLSATSFPYSWIWAVLIYVLAQNILEVLLADLRMKDATGLYAFFSVCRAGLDVGLTVYFITMAGKSWEGRVEGQTLAVGIMAMVLLSIFVLRSDIKFKWDRNQLRHLLKYGAPLIPHVIGGMIITFSDRLFIEQMVGLGDVGLYTVGYQVGMVISLLQNSFNQAWVPWFYGRLKEDTEEGNRMIVKRSYLFILAVFTTAIVLTLVSPWLFDWFMDKDFSGGAAFVGWIAVGMAFTGVYKVFVNYLFYHEKTGVIAIVTLFTALLNIVLNYFLILKFSTIGAAIATTISLFFQCLVVAIICIRKYKMPWFSK